MMKFSSSKCGPYILSPPEPSKFVMSPPWTIHSGTATQFTSNQPTSAIEYFTKQDLILIKHCLGLVKIVINYYSITG